MLRTAARRFDCTTARSIDPICLHRTGEYCPIIAKLHSSIVGGWKLLNGSRHPFDYQQALQLAESEISRANSLKGMFNHALLTGGEELYGAIGRVPLPFLVIHGTEDPVLPYAHGKALAEAVQNSKLLTLAGAGHELHENDWDTAIQAIVEHTQE